LFENERKCSQNKEKTKTEKTGFEKIKVARNKNSESKLLAAEGS